MNLVVFCDKVSPNDVHCGGLQYFGFSPVITHSSTKTDADIFHPRLPSTIISLPLKAFFSAEVNKRLLGAYYEVRNEWSWNGEGKKRYETVERHWFDI